MNRIFAVCTLLALSACGATPQSLGITGPQADAPVTQYINPAEDPDALQSGSRYRPNMLPTTAGGRYWGYD